MAIRHYANQPVNVNKEKVLVGAFYVIVKLRIIFGNLRFKLYWTRVSQSGPRCLELGGHRRGVRVQGSLSLRHVSWLLAHSFIFIIVISSSISRD